MISRGNNEVRIPIQRASERDRDQLTPDQEQKSQDNLVDAISKDCEANIDQWRDTALRLKADMQNFRKRQERWAQNQVQSQQDQLLLRFVSIVDDLEKVIVHLDVENVTHQGVKIAYDNMLQLLAQQGVEKIDALNDAFDPMLHEAVVMVPGPKSQLEPMLVKEVIRPGYRIGERLLRPSQVVVGKRI